MRIFDRDKNERHNVMYDIIALDNRFNGVN